MACHMPDNVMQDTYCAFRQHVSMLPKVWQSASGQPFLRMMLDILLASSLWSTL